MFYYCCLLSYSSSRLKKIVCTLRRPTQYLSLWPTGWVPVWPFLASSKLPRSPLWWSGASAAMVTCPIWLKMTEHLAKTWKRLLLPLNGKIWGSHGFHGPLLTVVGVHSSQKSHIFMYTSAAVLIFCLNSNFSMWGFPRHSYLHNKTPEMHSIQPLMMGLALFLVQFYSDPASNANMRQIF